jgi:predicted transcriptional regulator
MQLRILDAEYISKLFHKGYSVKSIAKNLSVCPSTVAKNLARLGLRRKRPVVDVEKARRMYLYQGMTAKEVAFKLGNCPTAVCNALRKAGVNLRNRYANFDLTVAIQMYEKGKTVADIARELNFCAFMLRKAFLTRGVKLKTRSESAKIKWIERKKKWADKLDINWEKIKDKLDQGFSINAISRDFAIPVHVLRFRARYENRKIISRLATVRSRSEEVQAEALKNVDWNALRAKYEAGVQIKPLSAETKITCSCLRRHFKQMGIKLRSKQEISAARRAKLKEQAIATVDWDQIKIQYLAGDGLFDLAAQYGMPRHWIKQRLGSMGVAFRTRAQNKVLFSERQHQAVIASLDWSRVKAQYQSGQKMRQLGKEYGLPEEIIRRKLHEMNAVAPASERNLLVAKVRREKMLAPFDWEAIAQQYRDGRTVESITIETKLTVRMVKQKLESMGVKLRSVADAQKERRDMALRKIDWSPISCQYQDGKSTFQIANELKLPVSWIRHQLKVLNVFQSAAARLVSFKAKKAQEICHISVPAAAV